MSLNNISNKFLLIFDFDGTIIDKDSEEELLKNIFSKEEYNNIMNELDNLEFYEGFNFYFKRMKSLGLSLNDININLEKIKLSPGINELFDYLRKNKPKYKIIICSSGIDYSIKYILKYYGFLDLIDDFICTKGYIGDEKSDTLIYVPLNQFPNSCELCTASQCKSNELQKYLKKNKFDKILYICDGSNDFCPSKKILKKDDIVFTRINNSLYKKLFEENYKNELCCEIFPWKNGDEIVQKLNLL